MNQAELRGRLEGARVARLATVRPDGAPHVVPVVFALHGDTLFTSVDGKPKRDRTLRRLENIEANPRVELVVDHYEEDWEGLWWIRVSGTARVAEGGADRDRGAGLLVEKYPQYDRWGPLGEMIVVDIESWRWWSSGPPERSPERPG